MQSLSHTKTIDEKIQKLASIYETLNENGDKEAASKAEMLAHKFWKNEFIAGFCGHFSAGKSTMINALAGEELLPSSPIPTSANLVKVHQAEADFAKVHYHDKQSVIFDGAYDFNIVKRYCKDGEKVQSIEIGKKHTKLPNGVTVLDTPGVDSTDDAHRISTESALHLADIVFYVMDYNHVQSQLNFEYTRELANHGVRLYLIVNQIDKHNEEELSFDQFKQSVSESFAAWQVKPERIFFTSLREQANPNNEFVEVRDLINRQFQNKDELLQRSFAAGVNRLVSEHQQWLREDLKAQKELLSEVISSEDIQNAEDLFQKESSLNKKIKENSSKAYIQTFEEEREKILKNAYLMPFETRELAKRYLESLQDDFKVGMFFSKKKTEEERQLRLSALVEHLKNNVESQLEWHLRGLGSLVMKQAGFHDEDLMAKSEGLKVEVTESDLKETAKAGARVTGEYVLNYCEELAGRLKRKARRETESLKERLMVLVDSEKGAENEGLKEQYDLIKKKTDALKQLEYYREDVEIKINNLQSIIEGTVNVNSEETVENWQDEWDKNDKNYTLYSKENDLEDIPESENRQSVPEEGTEEAETEGPALEPLIKRLNEMSVEFEDISGLNQTAQLLRKKAERLQDQQFTIALFGAFSAGKSSFANALLGSKVLPVSPNPTTASINRIRPPMEGQEHGTAKVILKTEQQMLADVQNSLKVFQHGADSLQAAADRIPGLLRSSAGEGKEKVHLSFLAAFLKGYEQYHSKLGEVLRVGLDEFRGFVANESQSCFVESIDLFYDSPITRQGITLVDTPGADSINARHTGVAFQYIKNSDAILFVTYYNHAFAKADREFLIQLGRVKDAFEMDKMFFIVNAVDLAKDEEEKQDVIEYVRGQLVEYGIRFPRIFGVSSKLAMDSNRLEESGIETFKKEFNQFIDGELKLMAAQSAESEWERGMNRLKTLIENSSMDERERESRKEELLMLKGKVHDFLDSEAPESIKLRVTQEIKELIHYVKQRVFLRFSDFFKEAFHPAVFSQHASAKAALNAALEELLESTGFDFAQEMRATTLRVENFSRKQLNSRVELYMEKLKKLEDNLVFSPYETGNPAEIEFTNAFSDLERVQFLPALRSFKNPKDFFEGNGKKKVMEKLNEDLQGPADQYLDHSQQQITGWAVEYLKAEHSRMTSDLLSQSDEQIESWLNALQSDDNLEKWKETYSRLSAYK
ncbi:dynamin family protein [Bacillus sp. SCS-153A]|uniref:dynamin family protein n=1 Tax=Rossellomorea sedimentorum TaxID=3115294 RepID=UPI003906416D